LVGGVKKYFCLAKEQSLQFLKYFNVFCLVNIVDFSTSSEDKNGSPKIVIKKFLFSSLVPLIIE